jgi:hypothetical protein
MYNSRSRSPERAGAERRGRVRRSVLALCAVIGVVVSQPASAQLLVDPLELTILAAGTNRASASFSLANTSDEAVQATITRSDWDRLENGDNRFLPTVPGSSASRFRRVPPSRGNAGTSSSSRKSLGALHRRATRCSTSFGLASKCTLPRLGSPAMAGSRTWLSRT